MEQLAKAAGSRDESTSPAHLTWTAQQHGALARAPSEGAAAATASLSAESYAGAGKVPYASIAYASMGPIDGAAIMLEVRRGRRAVVPLGRSRGESCVQEVEGGVRANGGGGHGGPQRRLGVEQSVDGHLQEGSGFRVQV